MGYKLADGSDSDLYQDGDTFMCGRFKGKIIHLPNRLEPVFQPDYEGPDFADQFVAWSQLTPTKETKRKFEIRNLYRGIDAKRNQSKCKCFSEVMINLAEISGIDIDKEKLEQVKTTVNIHFPEPLARIIDWRNNELVVDSDIVVSDDGTTWAYDDFCIHRQNKLGASGCNTVIRINTAAIPKQRTMTKIEVEQEFGVKVVD